MFKDLPGFPSSERLQPLARNFNLRLIVLFGSAARGATNQESDLDLGVLAEQPLPAAPRLNLWRALSSLFRADVDLTMLNQASPLVNYQVASEGIVLLGNLEIIRRATLLGYQ